MPSVLDSLRDAIAAILPGSAGEEVKRNIEAVIRSHFEQMDLVSREQLDIQQKILERTRQRVSELEQQLEALEKQLDNN